MKIKGKRPEVSNVIPIVLPRFNGEDVVFTARVVMDYTELDKLLKDPEPPMLIRKGKQEKDHDDKGYLSKLQKNYEHRLNWMVLKSLEATEGLEWETVEMGKPSTWGNWEQELKESGIPNSEVLYIFNKVQEVNSLDQAKLDEARDRFLQTLSARADA